MRITHSQVARSLRLALHGQLDESSVTQIRTALRKALLDSPTPVVCDLTGVRGFSAAALTLFPTAFAQAGGWPAVRFALMDPPPALASALRKGGVTRRVPVLTSQQVMEGPLEMWRPQVLTRSVGLSSGGHAAAEARFEVTTLFGAAGCGETLLDDAKVVASELATNAVVHGAPPIELNLLASKTALIIAVSDASGSPAMVGGEQVESGRGLQIVQAVAAAWNCDSVPGDGKTVWARLRR